MHRKACLFFAEDTMEPELDHLREHGWAWTVCVIHLVYHTNRNGVANEDMVRGISCNHTSLWVLVGPYPLRERYGCKLYASPDVTQVQMTIDAEDNGICALGNPFESMVLYNWTGHVPLYTRRLWWKSITTESCGCCSQQSHVHGNICPCFGVLMIP